MKAKPSASACLGENMLAKSSSAAGKAIKNEQKQALMEALQSMDPVDQEIILMRAFEDLSNLEAAETLGLSVQGASNRYVRAMARLQRTMKSVMASGD